MVPYSLYSPFFIAQKGRKMDYTATRYMDIYKVDKDFEEQLDRIAYQYFRERKYELTLYAKYELLKQVNKWDMNRYRIKTHETKGYPYSTCYILSCGIEVEMKHDLSEVLLDNEFGVVVGRKGE